MTTTWAASRSGTSQPCCATATLVQVAPAVRRSAPDTFRSGHARALLAQPDNTVTSIAKLLGVSRTTIYEYVPELKAGARTAFGPQGGPKELESAEF
jgi:transposase-like protein